MRIPTARSGGAQVSARRLLLSLLLLASSPIRGAADPCPKALSPDTTRHLFERVQQVQVAKGYRFDGIEADETLRVKWSLDGTPCPLILVDFGACTVRLAPPTLQLHVPPDLLTRCPGLGGVVDELSKAVQGEQPADVSKPPVEWSPPPSVWPKVVAILAFAAFALMRYLQAPRADGAFGWRGVQQIAFVLVASNVLFLRTRDVVDTQLMAAWLVFAVLLIDRDRWAREGRIVNLLLVGLFSFSLVLHWALSHGGPGDAHLNLYALWSPNLDPHWGQGPIALLRGLQMLIGGIRDTHIIWCNLILSSLVPVLLFGIVSELGFGGVAAMSAAFIVALHPLLILFSGVLERQPMYLFAACGSLLALIRFLERDDWARFVAFVLGTILAMTCRPEGAHVVILQLAVVLLLPATRHTRGVSMLTIVLLGMLGFAYAHRFAHGEAPSRTFTALTNPAPFLWTILMDPDFTPAAWIVMWIVGMLLGLRNRTGWIVVMSLLSLHVVWQWTGVYEMFVGVERQVASSRYESILLIPFTIGIALFIEHLAAIRGAAKAGAILIVIAGTLLTFRRTYVVLLKPFTIDYEYDFLKHHALTLPPRSTIWVFDSPDPDEGFFDASLVGRFVGTEVRFDNWPYAAEQCYDSFGKGSQDYIYIGSSCAELVDTRAPEHELWMQDCRLIRSRVAADAVDEIDVPARKLTWHEFANPTVRLGIYKIGDASVCAAGLSALRHRIPISP